MTKINTLMCDFGPCCRLLAEQNKSSSSRCFCSKGHYWLHAVLAL